MRQHKLEGLVHPFCIRQFAFTNPKLLNLPSFIIWLINASSNRIKRDGHCKVAQKTSDAETYVILCQRLFPVHLQETGRGGDFFDVTREEAAFAVQMSPLLHYMKCRSWYLTSKTRESLNPLFAIPTSCSVFSLTLPHQQMKASHICFIIMHCNFTRVSVSISSCNSYKNLGAHQELAEHCLRRQVGAPERSGYFQSPEPQAQCAPHLRSGRAFHSHLMVSLSWIRVKRESFKKSQHDD